MKFCSDCGTQIEDSAKFCVNCGKFFGEPTPVQPQNQVPVQPQNQVPVQPQQPTPFETKKKSSSLLIIIIVVAVLLLGGGAYVILDGFDIIDTPDLFSFGSENEKDNDDEDEDKSDEEKESSEDESNNEDKASEDSAEKPTEKPTEKPSDTVLSGTPEAGYVSGDYYMNDWLGIKIKLDGYEYYQTDSSEYGYYEDLELGGYTEDGEFVCYLAIFDDESVASLDEAVELIEEEFEQADDYNVSEMEIGSITFTVFEGYTQEWGEYIVTLIAYCDGHFIGINIVSEEADVDTAQSVVSDFINNNIKEY